MPLNQPQPAIFKEGSTHFYFLEYQFITKDIREIKHSITQSLSTVASDVSVLVGFGLDAWNLLQPNWTPATLESFETITGRQGHQAPSTQADVFFWVHGASVSDVYDEALHVHFSMQRVAKLTLEERGFDYHQSKDLFGFEDGTGNPKTDALKRDAALIPEGVLGAAGSLVLTQKWVHDLDKWNQVPVHCQEGIIGRTKIENIELEGDAMPDDSHVSRTDIKIDGVPMKIYRRSAPFGSMKERGLYFLAFACELKRFRSQLESMYGLTEDNKIDQIINYSQAVSGAYWFAPAQQDLDEMLSTDYTV